MLQCPKCQAELRSYERNGITVDQCVGCRGVFLDAGELERLIQAESAWYGAPAQQPVATAPAPPTAPVPQARPYGRHDHDYDSDSRHRGYGHKPYKRKSFLREMLDFD